MRSKACRLLKGAGVNDTQPIFLTHHGSVDALGVIFAFVVAFRTLVPSPATRCLNADLEKDRMNVYTAVALLVIKYLCCKPCVVYLANNTKATCAACGCG